MKKFLISYYFRAQGGSSRLGGGYTGDRTGYGNMVWECENLFQNDDEIFTLEKDIANRIQALSVKILAISPLQ